MILKKLSIVIALLLCGYQSFSQGNWGGGVDNDNVHFGFTFQYNSSEFRIYKTPDWRQPFPDPNTPGSDLTSPLVSISSPASSGFGLGFVTDVRLGNHLNLRATPLLVFADRFVDYHYENPAEYTRKIVQSATVDLPLGFKLKSDRRSNFRAYLIAGVKYSIDIISKKKLNDSGPDPYAKLVKNNRGILWYEAGIGFDLYFEYFKLSPEIKLANSFHQVLDRYDSPNAYTKPLDKLFLRNLQFSLYFE